MGQEKRRETNVDDTHRAQVTPVALGRGVFGHDNGYAMAAAPQANGLVVVRL